LLVPPLHAMVLTMDWRKQIVHWNIQDWAKAQKAQQCIVGTGCLTGTMTVMSRRFTGCHFVEAA
jgi:hypothetical protein